MSEEKIIKEIEKIIFDLDMVDFNKDLYSSDEVETANYQVKYIKKLLDLYNKQKEEIEELKKYDYRNMKIDENNKIYSPNFTDSELHFMNFGIAIYESMQNFDKLNDENDI